MFKTHNGYLRVLCHFERSEKSHLQVQAQVQAQVQVQVQVKVKVQVQVKVQEQAEVLDYRFFTSFRMAKKDGSCKFVQFVSIVAKSHSV